MLENNLDVWGVRLLGIGEEVDGLDQEGVNELLGGMRGVASDWKHCGQNPVQEDREVVLAHFVGNHLLDDVTDDRVQKLACHYLDLISPVDGQPAGAIQQFSNVEGILLVEDGQLEG